MNERAMKALAQVAACSTWTIVFSSEHCKIDISGIPVLMKTGNQTETFYESGPCDLAQAIISASEAFNAACYPHRLETQP